MNPALPEHITKFFEGDQEVYNAILQDVFNEQEGNKQATFSIDQNTTGIINNLYQKVEAYIKAGDPKIIDIGTIEIGKADTFD
jgi:hypothetical protein